jgi:integrase
MANKKGARRRFGSVRQLRSGRWQIRYPDPITGLMRPGEETYATKTDAELALTLIEADIARDKYVDPDAGKVNFGEFAKTWLRDRKLEETTRQRYANVLHAHILATLGRKTVAEITPARVRAWRTKLLDGGVGEPTVVKGYQLLRAIMNTAVDDELIQRNPCRIKGADTYDVPERPVLTVAQVITVADEITPRFRAIVLLAAFTTLRFGELAALRRGDVDTEALTVYVRRNQAELTSGKLYDKAPKTRAGVRPVAFPAEILPDVLDHLDRFVSRSAKANVFTGPRGGLLRRSNFSEVWGNARTAAGLGDDVHFHDLRHTGNTLASSNGASTKELMTRMGHSSSRAALIYQHMTAGRDRAIADGLGELIRKEREARPSDPPSV